MATSGDHCDKPEENFDDKSIQLVDDPQPSRRSCRKRRPSTMVTGAITAPTTQKAKKVKAIDGKDEKGSSPSHAPHGEERVSDRRKRMKALLSVLEHDLDEALKSGIKDVNGLHGQRRFAGRWLVPNGVVLEEHIGVVLGELEKGVGNAGKGVGLVVDGVTELVVDGGDGVPALGAGVVEDVGGLEVVPFSCNLCGRNFKSKKALHGHMRSHPERSWRGMIPPPHAAHVVQVDRVDQSQFTQEERDVADILLYLKYSDDAPLHLKSPTAAATVKESGGEALFDLNLPPPEDQ